MLLIYLPFSQKKMKCVYSKEQRLQIQLLHEQQKQTKKNDEMGNQKIQAHSSVNTFMHHKSRYNNGRFDRHLILFAEVDRKGKEREASLTLHAATVSTREKLTGGK